MTRPHAGAQASPLTAAPVQTPGGAPAGAPPVAPAAGSAPRRKDKAAKASLEDPAKAGRVKSRKVTAVKKPPRITALQLKRIDPWTVLKISLIVSIVMFFVWMIAIGLLYLLFGSMDVFTTVNDAYGSLFVSETPGAVQGDLITPGRVFGIAAIIGAVNIVLFTALSAIGAFVYNAAAGMAGGVEVTLGERD